MKARAEEATLPVGIVHEMIVHVMIAREVIVTVVIVLEATVIAVIAPEVIVIAAIDRAPIEDLTVVMSAPTDLRSLQQSPRNRVIGGGQPCRSKTPSRTCGSLRSGEVPS